LKKNQGRGFSFASISAVMDGAGGFIIAWPDTSEESMRYSTHLARFSSDGKLLWQRDFIYFDLVVSDGSGGVIIAFDHPAGVVTDDALKSFSLVRVDSQGEYPWGLQGVSVPCAKYYDSTLQMVPDGSGGIILAWRATQYPAGAEPGQAWSLNSLFAQKVNAEGKLVWGENPLIVNEFPKDMWIDSLKALADSNGGIILSWFQVTEDPTAEAGHRQTWDVAVQKIDADGNMLWSPGGIPFEITKTNFTAAPMEPSLAGDGSGGAIVIWRDMRRDDAGEASVYAQRVDASGQLLWQAGGVKVSSTSLNPRPVIASCSTDEAFIAYSFKEDNQYLNIQKLDGNGRVGWQENGVTIVDDRFYAPLIVPDGQGGVIVACTIASRAFLQRLNPEGQIIWGEKGIRIKP
jgi:hypothetical protein